MSGDYVLFVDDEPGMHMLLDLILRPLALDVRHARSGTESLQMVAAQRPGVILLDLMMPDLSGADVLKRLSSSADTSDIPVIIYTAHHELARNNGQPWPPQVVEVYEKATVHPVQLRERVHSTLAGKPPQQPQAQGRPQNGRAALSGRVLIADDDRDSREILGRILSYLGLTVELAADGREALDAVKRQLPDVLLLDLMMPRVSGFEVLSQLRNHAETARIPVIIISALDTLVDDRLRLPGVFRVLRKSQFSIAEVRQVVAGALEKLPAASQRPTMLL